MAFENNVSRVVRELVFDRHLIANGPKRPAQRPYASPQYTTETAPIRKKEPTQVRRRVGVPGLVESRTDGTPGETGQVALEKDMVGIFMLTTERASTIRRAMSNGNVVGRRKAISEELPKENFDLQRDGRFP